MRRRSVILIVAAALLVAVMYAGWSFLQRGFSARDNPSALETYAARLARSLATPAEAKGARNPFSLTPEILAEARGHFADHCATCHANDGSGQTEIGRNLYPKAPDMRLAHTQNLTDGEIYYIIHNGIRLTGMPAWGDADHDEDSWKLVYFIRHLPKLTANEIQEMERLNPRSFADWEQRRMEEEFLRGTEPKAKQPGHEH